MLSSKGNKRTVALSFVLLVKVYVKYVSKNETLITLQFQLHNAEWRWQNIRAQWHTYFIRKLFLIRRDMLKQGKINLPGHYILTLLNRPTVCVVMNWSLLCCRRISDKDSTSSAREKWGSHKCLILQNSNKTCRGWVGYCLHLSNQRKTFLYPFMSFSWIWYCSIYICGSRI